jgi:hypothetical protein
VIEGAARSGVAGASGRCSVIGCSIPSRTLRPTFIGSRLEDVAAPQKEPPRRTEDYFAKTAFSLSGGNCEEKIASGGRLESHFGGSFGSVEFSTIG